MSSLKSGTSDRVDQLWKKRSEYQQGGGKSRIDKQHKLGKMTARERLSCLFDHDSFQETHLFMKHRCTHFGMAGKEVPGEGVVTGVGLADGRTVYAASQDFTVAGGSVGEANAYKVQQLMDDALKTGDPFVFINDSGGARIQEGVDALSGDGGIFNRNIMLSGVVPQISIGAGPCAGGAAYSPALTDFIIQVRHEGRLFITGPQVIRQVTGEEITADALGGVESHAHYSGVVHFVAEDDEEALSITRRLLSFLPSNNMDESPYCSGPDGVDVIDSEALNHVVPEDSKMAYDMREVVWGIVDDADFLEVQEHFAENLLIGFGRLLGRTVGIVANQPKHKAGVLDINSSVKGSRFIRFCNAFNIPIITFVDVPGFLPGVDQEHYGIITHGSKLLFAYCEATVPKVTIVTRKAYGGAYVVMSSKHIRADVNLAFPTAEFAVMGPDGAVNIVFRKELAEADDPVARKDELVADYREKFANPFKAAELGYIDEVIKPEETRPKIIEALQMLATKRDTNPPKKHGNIPL